MFYCIDEKRSVELGLNLNSSTKVDGEIRQAQLAQNPMLAADFLSQSQTSFLISLDNSFSLFRVIKCPPFSTL